MVGSIRSTEVFIIGGGPAGLAAAIAARKKGLEVMVADGAAPPIEKPCGEGLLPETLTALGALGVEFQAGEGRNFRGVGFLQEDARVFGDFPGEPGMGLRRPLLHERLVTRAEECGVEFLWKTPVSGIYADGVQLGREKIRARWIIGADGQGSRARRWSGLEAEKISKKRFAIRHHYRVKPWSNYMEVYWGADTQAYVTPGSEQEICIVVMSERAEHATFERAFSQFGELRDRLRGSELSSRQRGAVTAMRSLQNVQRGNVALVGDASGGVDAITGEGLRLAFRQAFALAAAMAAGDLTRYEAAHERLARRPLAMCGLMLWLGRHPRIRARVLRALENKPELFTRLLAMHVGEGSPADVVSAGALLGWQLLAV